MNWKRYKKRQATKTPGILGHYAPWAWGLEPVRGCNLKCGHCAVRLFDEPVRFMKPEVWSALWSIIAEVTPTNRVEMANAGEPTLHPDLLKYLRMARRTSPGSQIQITTNGTMLVKEKISYSQLFNAGANIIYVDMYASKEKHLKLAEKSRVPFYEYHSKPKDAPGAWSYHGPDFKLIVLMDAPQNWPERRRKLGGNRLGTFLNHLDWDAAKKFGLVPVTQSIRRRCTQPFRYVSIHVDGEYEFCCQDFMGESVGKLGNVLDGTSGFLKFWFGEEMQRIRTHLRNAERGKIDYCSRCDIIYSRSDYRMWNEDILSRYWDGQNWQKLEV